MARKIAELRILRDERSVADAGAPVLVVSQFTLYADTRKGRRPVLERGGARPRSPSRWSTPSSRPCAVAGVEVATGRFGAMMAVDLVNDGPFTLVVDI